MSNGKTEKPALTKEQLKAMLAEIEQDEHEARRPKPRLAPKPIAIKDLISCDVNELPLAGDQEGVAVIISLKYPKNGADTRSTFSGRGVTREDAITALAQNVGMAAPGILSEIAANALREDLEAEPVVPEPKAAKGVKAKVEELEDMTRPRLEALIVAEDLDVDVSPRMKKAELIVAIRHARAKKVDVPFAADETPPAAATETENEE